MDTGVKCRVLTVTTWLSQQRFKIMLNLVDAISIENDATATANTLLGRMKGEQTKQT